MKRSLVLLILLIPVLSLALLAAGEGVAGPVRFYDAQKQSQEFIGYYQSITLNSQQEATKKRALSTIPAPCCSENSIYTCCCPCNLAKTVWGLSNYLIARQGYNAEQVHQAAVNWIEFVNRGGYQGDTCHTAGGCQRPFAQGGCGGMGNAVKF
jgi:hypothetical protein